MPIPLLYRQTSESMNSSDGDLFTHQTTKQYSKEQKNFRHSNEILFIQNIFNNTVYSFVDINIEAPMRSTNFILSPLFKIIKVFNSSYENDFFNKVT